MKHLLQLLRTLDFGAVESDHHVIDLQAGLAGRTILIDIA